MVKPNGVLDDGHRETVAVRLGVDHGASAYPNPIKATQPFKDDENRVQSDPDNEGPSEISRSVAVGVPSLSSGNVHRLKSKVILRGFTCQLRRNI